MSSAIQQEYEEGMQALGAPRMQVYKLLSLFSFENGNEIHFGEGLASFCPNREHYDQLKEYIKEQKKWVKTTAESVSILQTRLWWLQIKLVEFGIFSPSEQRLVFPLLVLQSP
jgi:hypothetical protein